MGRIQNLPMNCNFIARHYELLEHLSFGKCLERRRFAFLQETRSSLRAILCGGGDGRFLGRLLCSNPLVEVDFVELSRNMTELAERRVAALGRSFRERVKFYAGDVREFATRPEGYDLIVTNFFLDCFTEPELGQVVARLARSAAPQARWIVSEFREADGLFGRFWTTAIIRGLYAAFRLTTGLRVTTLPDYAAALASQSFEIRCEETAFGGLLHSSLWEGGSPHPGILSRIGDSATAAL
ncbi:MAG: class I SAM-dependent methyltransferase [Candidatus Acidiferrum sp.]